MISKEEVKHIADLARLKLSDKETEKMQKDLSAILDYFALLKKAPTKNLQNKILRKQTNVFRKDEIISSNETAGELIALAPDKKDGYIKVKQVL